MNLLTGDMPWTSMHKIPNKYTYLSNDIECDVLIIGAGITGALAAYHIAEPNLNTVIVDKNIIGYGSTSVSTSILQYEIDNDLIGLSSIIGYKNALKVFKLCEQAVYDIKSITDKLNDDCEFSLKECFYYTDNSSLVSYLKREYELRKSNGFDVEFIDHENSFERFSFNVKGGIYSKSGAAQINPYKFTHALINESIKKGLTVFENTEIISINPSDEYVILETKNKFKIKSKKVIISCGYESREYIKEKIATLYRTFTIVTKPIENFYDWYNKCIIRDNKDPYIYLRTTNDNRIIIGGEDEKLGGLNCKIANLSNDDNAANIKYDTLLQKLKSLFPLIKDIEVEYKFSGLFGVTKDSLPYIGEHKAYPNCYFSLGYGSNGILYALLGAQLIKELYLGNYPSDMDLFKFGR